MTPATAAALRCPVCGGPLLLAGRSLRCARAHSFDLAKEGYAYLLPMQKKHAADPGDGKAMVRARRAFLSAGHYAPLMATLAALCAALPHDHIVDAGCGEGSYDKYLYDALGFPQIAAFDLSKEAVRLASKLVPDAAFCVGGSFCAPVRDGWADLLLNIFSPMAEAEFARMLRPGGHLVYAVPTARHLFGLKEILYDCPYENEVRQTEYDGFAFVKAVESTAVITLEGQSVQDLFAMTPYYWNTPADGAARLGSTSDLPVMEKAAKLLDEMHVPFEMNALSAHRTPEAVEEFAKNAAGRGIKVIIAAAGMAAALPGVIAANTTLPVIGVPVKGSVLDGVDALYSIIQMPPGIPVATVAINGAMNAAILAVQMLALSDTELAAKFADYKTGLKKKIVKANEELKEVKFEYKTN